MLSGPTAFTKRVIYSNVEHIEEIREAGLELPLVNQIEVPTVLLLTARAKLPSDASVLSA